LPLFISGALCTLSLPTLLLERVQPTFKLYDYAVLLAACRPRYQAYCCLRDSLRHHGVLPQHTKRQLLLQGAQTLMELMIAWLLSG
jgi:hypothetical protein